MMDNNQCDNKNKNSSKFFEKRELDEATLRAIAQKRFLTTREAAIYLGTTDGGIRNRVYRGQLEALRYHGRLMFRLADIDRLIESSSKRRSK